MLFSVLTVLFSIFEAEVLFTFKEKKELQKVGRVGRVGRVCVCYMCSMVQKCTIQSYCMCTIKTCT